MKEKIAKIFAIIVSILVILIFFVYSLTNIMYLFNKYIAVGVTSLVISVILI